MAAVSPSIPIARRRVKRLSVTAHLRALRLRQPPTTRVLQVVMQAYRSAMLRSGRGAAIIGWMKASFFVSLPYGPVGERTGRWPVPNRLFDAERAVDVVTSRMAHVELADELGFDWIGCA